MFVMRIVYVVSHKAYVTMEMRIAMEVISGDGMFMKDLSEARPDVQGPGRRH